MPFVDNANFKLSGGRWFVTGLEIIFSKVSLDYSALIDNLLRSWAMSAANLLYVLGILVAGLILIT